MHPVDIGAACYLLYALYKGVRRGLASELARLAGMLLVIGSAWWYHPVLGNYLIGHTRIDTEKAGYTVAFILLLVAGYVILLAVRLLLKLILDFHFKGGLERVGGGVVGGLRASLVLAALVYLLYLGSQGPFYDNVSRQSKVGAAVVRLVLSPYEQLAADYPGLRLPVRNATGTATEPGERLHGRTTDERAEE